MTRRGPTVLFDTITELHTLLALIEWPDVMGTAGDILNSDGVRVTFGDVVAEEAREWLAVTGTVDDDNQDRWPEMGLASKRETFSTPLVLTTAIPGRTAVEAWARLRAIVHTIDAALRDLDTGRPNVPTAAAVLGVQAWSVTGVETHLWPADEHGFAAGGVITIGVTAHI